MKRKLAMSDVHGQYESMITLLHAANFNPQEDQLVLLGDLIDRGPDSVKVIKFVKKLQEQNPENIFVILGNHEIMMRQYVFGGKNHMWLRYGGLQVVEEMKTYFEGKQERNDHLVWMANLPLTHCDEEYIYVHAGIDFSQDLKKQQEDITFMKIRAMYSVNPYILSKNVGNRMIVHGHTPYSSVYKAGSFISCDTGASVMKNGKLALVDLTNNIYFSKVTSSTETFRLPIENIKLKERIKYL